jgi:hypothetical protein
MIHPVDADCQRGFLRPVEIVYKIYRSAYTFLIIPTLPCSLALRSLKVSHTFLEELLEGFAGMLVWRCMSY